MADCTEHCWHASTKPAPDDLPTDCIVQACCHCTATRTILREVAYPRKGASICST